MSGSLKLGLIHFIIYAIIKNSLVLENQIITPVAIFQLDPESYVQLAMIAVITLLYFFVSGKLMKSNPGGRLITICGIIALVSFCEYRAWLEQRLPIPPFDFNPAQSLAAVYAIFILGLIIFIAEYQRSSSLLIRRYRDLLWERTHVLELSAVVIGLMLSVTLTGCLMVFGALLSLVVGFELLKSLYNTAYFQQTEENYYLYICSKTAIILREIEKSKNKGEQETKINRFIDLLKKLELEYTEASKSNFYSAIDGYISILWMQIVTVFRSKNIPKGTLSIPIAKFLYQIKVEQEHAKQHPDNHAILKHVNKAALNLIGYCLKTEDTELMQELVSEENQKLKGFKNYLETLIEDDESKILEDTEQPMRQNGLSLVENVQHMLKKTENEPTIRFLNQVNARLSSGEIEKS